MRLQKFLAQAGVASRRRAETLIARRPVKVNGDVVTAAGQTVNPESRTGSRWRASACGRDAHLPPAAQAARLPGHAERARAASARHPGALRPRPEPGLAGGGAARFPRRGRAAADHRRRAGRGDVAGGGGGVTMTYHLKFQGLVGDERHRAAAAGLEVGAPVGQARGRGRAGHHRQEHLGRDGRRREPAAGAQGDRRGHPQVGAEDLARPPGPAVVRGAGDGRAGAT